MSNHADLRRTIQALCAPAVIALLASHAPVVEAAVTARDGLYGYDAPDTSSTTTITTFSFPVLKNDEGIISQGGPLVDGSPRPLQLSDAAVTSADIGVNAVATPFRNCIMVTVTNDGTGTSGSSSFTITYTVADAQGNPDAGELTFVDFGENSFIEEQQSSQCNDEGFQGSTVVADAATTPANTAVTIAVLDNDTVGQAIEVQPPPVLTPTALALTPIARAALTADGRTDVQADATSQNGGTVQVNTDGTITYTPLFGFSGTDTFTYTIQDYNPAIGSGFAALNPQRVTVTVDVVAAADTPAIITVNGNVIPNGTNLSVPDSDLVPGETVTFDGSQTLFFSEVPADSFQWFVGDSQTPQGTDATFSPQLPDGVSQVRLIASLTLGEGETATATSVINVMVAAAGAATTLADIPNLTPNQRSVAQALDRICQQLVQRLQSEQALSTNQQDLLERCQGILAAGTGDQIRALDELGAQDFNGARLQTLLFTNSLYAGVMDRLMALRGGVKGLSLTGLNLVIDGKPVPLAELQRMVGHMLGGGAAADEPGSLLGDRLGMWSRGSFTFGDKDRSRNDGGFDADQYSLTIGLDYRLSDKMVLGGALAFGSSNLSYNPNDEGGLDTKSWALSLYGSRYAGKSFYVDALINAANSSYEAHRRISYNDAFGTVQRDARGDTDGLTLSSGLSGGYDFVYKGFTVSPNAGVFYVDSKIDDFREGGSAGLNLIYDEQTFQSLTGTFGLRVNYAWNLSWGVLVPYFRSDYVREFQKDVEVFSVRFASDPADPTPAIVVQSDRPDQSYVRLVGGVSGQFPFGLSGYIEYQRLQSFEFVDFNDLSMGLRLQYRY